MSTHPLPPSPDSPSRRPYIDPDIALERLFGSDAKFRTAEQRKMADIVLNTQFSSLVVLPTGEGKSLAWLLLAAMTDPASNIFYLVTVPLLTILQNHLAEAKRLGVSAMQWTAQSPLLVPRDVHLVFMSMETAISDKALRK
jgi:superfamily II DNA helicase RecQ